MSVIRRWLTPRRVFVVIALTGAWCMLWGSVTAANVLSGLVVSSVATVFGDPRPGGRSVRLGPLVVLSWLVAIDLVKATGSVVREILTPTDYTNEVIIAVDVPSHARSHLLLLVVAITVTPGTAVVDIGTGVEPGSGRLYLHLLHADVADDVIAHTQRLAELACRALPIDDPPPRIAATTTTGATTTGAGTSNGGGVPVPSTIDPGSAR